MLLYIVGGVLIVVALSGCKEWIDFKPENSVTFENAFETEKDIEAALLGTEQSVRANMTINNLRPRSRGFYSDYRQTGHTDLLSKDLSLGFYESDWGERYNVIASANVTLPYLDEVEMPQERRDFYRGCIAFFKAFAYLEIVCWWGDCVLVRDEVEMEPVGKTSWPQVIDYAIAQAREAVRLLPEWDELRDSDGNAVTHRARPCKGAANAVLAYLCAWKAGCKYMAQPNERDYDEEALWRASDSACSAIINRPDIYALESTPEDVCTRTFVDGGKECVYESVFHGYGPELDVLYLQYNLVSFGSYYESYPVIPGDYPGDIRGEATEYKILNTTVRTMFEEYTIGGKTRHDLRRDAWFYNFEEMEQLDESITGGYAYPYKWRYARVSTEEWNAGEFINFDQNKIWFRLADIYLLRAECQARLNNRDGAIADLNKIRERAGAKLYEESEYGGDLRYAIFKEREKELLMEGYRYLDVLRNGYYKTELYGGFRDVSEQDIIDGVFFNAVSSVEFIDNPLMRQNTYWLKFH